MRRRRRFQNYTRKFSCFSYTQTPYQSSHLPPSFLLAAMVKIYSVLNGSLNESMMRVPRHADGLLSDDEETAGFVSLLSAFFRICNSFIKAIRFSAERRGKKFGVNRSSWGKREEITVNRSGICCF